MLILSRKINETIVIDGCILVRVVRVDGEVVKLGIQAPKDIPVHRLEVYEEIQRANQEALTKGRQPVPKITNEPQAPHGGLSSAARKTRKWSNNPEGKFAPKVINTNIQEQTVAVSAASQTKTVAA